MVSHSLKPGCLVRQKSSKEGDAILSDFVAKLGAIGFKAVGTRCIKAYLLLTSWVA